MRANRTRTALALAATAVTAMAAGATGCGDDDGNGGTPAGEGAETTAPAKEGTTAPGEARTTPRPPAVPTVVVRGGEPVGGVEELVYDAGERVRFRVRSDVADEVHVHGYDLSKDVAAGGSVAFSFAADIEGIFEVELEGQGEQIAELRVEP